MNKKRDKSKIFNVSLGPLHRKLLIEANRKSLALNKRVSMAEVLRDALEEYFEKEKLNG